MEKMQKPCLGSLFAADSEELVRQRRSCQDLCFAYNQILPSQTEQRKKLIKQIFGKTGENILVEPSFWCDYGFHIEVGENFYANHNCVILDGAKVTFGDNVFIAPNCGFYTAGHPIDAKQRRDGLEYAAPITVGNDVWFGGNCIVLPGVTIGDNCVIGAGSVVNRSIPSGHVAAGNPCRILRKITLEDKR